MQGAIYYCMLSYIIAGLTTNLETIRRQRCRRYNRKHGARATPPMTSIPPQSSQAEGRLHFPLTSG